MWRCSTRVLPPERDPLTMPGRYTEQPRLSGYASPRQRARIASTPAICANRLGKGCVIRLVDNPSFRGFWYGTNRLVANSLFFAGAIDATRPLTGE